WMSAVLAGLDEHEGFDARGCRAYLGTSAGSIVAAALVAGLDPAARLGTLGGDGAHDPLTASSPAGSGLRQALGVASELAAGAAAPLASLALLSTARGGAVLRRVMLAKLPTGQRSLAELGRMVERVGPRWDGRLRITAVDLASGRRVVFGAPQAPEVSVAQAVQASCAIPGVFKPLAAGGHAYVDGGAWSPTNMDAVEVTRGDRVLCLNPTGSLRPTAGTLAGAFGPLSRAVATGEALALRRRGANVKTINPDTASAAAMGGDLMDARRRADVIAAGIAQGHAGVA
ncbi:MAG TPA: patatin-like phospholipase family protein, partial [Solirubrobacteraceae bacterium]